MSCNVWEEKGLLYSSGELIDEEVKEFEEHLKVCRECLMEWEVYLSSKKFFSTEILGELPSEECDREILRVCGDGRKQVAYLQIPFVSTMLRRSFISVAVFLFGFITVGLISIQIDTIKQQRRIASYKSFIKLAEKYDSSKVKSDSTVDTSDVENSQLINKGGSINNAGVYPVDLKNR
ncbi:MAG: hypothetical protein N2053_07475 [Chitinispirillaceae bacterium]|nr:hypothetical protein [Chitinispirillaceae bacterium]